MNRKAAIVAALGLVGVLAVGALAVSTNMSFDEDALAKGAKQELAKKQAKKPIVKHRTIRRHRTVQDGAGGAIVMVAGSQSDGGSDGSRGGSSAPVRPGDTRSANASTNISSNGGGNSSQSDSGDEGGFEEDEEDEHEEDEEEDEHEEEDHEDEGSDD